MKLAMFLFSVKVSEIEKRKGNESLTETNER